MKNILICISGLTPQVITETLFCLSYQSKIMIDELYVITTIRGKDVLMGIDKSQKTPKTSLLNEMREMCKKYKFKMPLFANNPKHIIVAAEETINLFDVKDDVSNQLFLNIIAKVLREKSENEDSNLYCSLSGGRKSMSAHIALAFTLFAKKDDKLFHVITDEQFEFNKFYPTNKKEVKSLKLSEIPFVKLRPILKENKELTKALDTSYTELVDYTQEVLNELNKKNLFLDTRHSTLEFDNILVKLPPLEYAIYKFFVDQKIENNNKLTLRFITEPSNMVKIQEILKQINPYYDFKQNAKRVWTLPNDRVRTLVSKINRSIKENFQPEYAEKFKIQSIKSWGNSQWFIAAERMSFKEYIS